MACHFTSVSAFLYLQHFHKNGRRGTEILKTSLRLIEGHIVGTNNMKISNLLTLSLLSMSPQCESYQHYFWNLTK